jgi:hypothetical protein
MVRSPILIGLLVPAFVARAQSAGPPTDKEEALRQLVRIENEIGRANREYDYAYFRQIEADEFIFTDAKGAVTTKAEDLAGEKDCRKADYEQSIDQPRLLLYGSVAVLNARNSVVSRPGDGKAVTRLTRFTDVFVWRDGRWHLVSGHSSRIPG